MRRTKGTGCISAMKNGPHKYRGLVKIGVNKNGNPKKKVFYGETKKEVEAKIFAYLNQDIPEQKETIVFNDALDLLIEQSVKERVKQKSLSIIETTSNILRKKWGYVSIENLFLNEVENQFLRWEEQYSFSQLQKLRNYGKKAFRLISDKYNLNYRNPFDIKLKAPDVPRHPNFFTEEELIAINAKMPEQYEDIVKFLYLTGMRINECLALTFGDINFKKRIIIVSKTLSETKQSDGHYGISVTTPKTRDSFRKVPIYIPVEEIIKSKIKENTKPNDLLFPSANKTYLSARNVLRAFDNALKKAGVEKKHRGLHAIRHSAIIRLFKEFSVRGRGRELDAIDIAKIVGNSVKISAYTYDNEQDERAKRIGEFLDESYKQTFTTFVAEKSEADIHRDAIQNAVFAEIEEIVQLAATKKIVQNNDIENYKCFAKLCYDVIRENGDFLLEINRQDVCLDTKLWNSFKQTNEIDKSYLIDNYS